MFLLTTWTCDVYFHSDTAPWHSSSIDLRSRTLTITILRICNGCCGWEGGLFRSCVLYQWESQTGGLLSATHRCHDGCAADWGLWRWWSCSIDKLSARPRRHSHTHQNSKKTRKKGYIITSSHRLMSMCCWIKESSYVFYIVATCSLLLSILIR